MKKLTTLLSVILLIAGCSSHPQVEPDEFIIEGCIEGLSDSCIVQLYKPDGQLLKVVAFDTVIDGHFSFRDEIPFPASRNITLRGVVRNFPVHR